MNYEELNRKLKQLKSEEIIWIIYIGIIIFSFAANYYERKYFITNSIDSKEKYRRLMVFIFSILIIIYIYFLKDSIDGIKSIKKNDSDKKKTLIYLSFIGSLLILISGLIFLYIAYSDEWLDVEIAFN